MDKRFIEEILKELLTSGKISVDDINDMLGKVDKKVLIEMVKHLYQQLEANLKPEQREQFLKLVQEVSEKK